MQNGPRKVVICGAGFLGSYITKALVNPSNTTVGGAAWHVQITSRRPEDLFKGLSSEIPSKTQLSCVSADVTQPETLKNAFRGANAVVSLVGILHGSKKAFEDIQWKGAENIACAAKNAGAKLVHISAIGADPQSSIDYARTKALGEECVRRICPDATIFRPSIVFGPGDGFFARFAKLSKFLPFFPVFGGGATKFQPVFAGDIASAVEIACRTSDEKCMHATKGRIFEAGGPDILSYREIMELVRLHTFRYRPILSLPYAIGSAQGFIMEKLPPSIFTLTRSQIEQLKIDNIVNPTTLKEADFEKLLQTFAGRTLTSVHEILPTYL